MKGRAMNSNFYDIDKPVEGMEALDLRSEVDYTATPLIDLRRIHKGKEKERTRAQNLEGSYRANTKSFFSVASDHKSRMDTHLSGRHIIRTRRKRTRSPGRVPIRDLSSRMQHKVQNIYHSAKQSLREEMLSPTQAVSGKSQGTQVEAEESFYKTPVAKPSSLFYMTIIGVLKKVIFILGVVALSFFLLRFFDLIVVENIDKFAYNIYKSFTLSLRKLEQEIVPWVM